MTKKPDIHGLAEKFVPMLAARSEEIEETRHLPQDLAKTFADAGFYRLCTPKAYGGLEASPLDYVILTETLARGDASASWCAFIGLTSMVTLARFDPAAAKTMLKNPEAIASGVFAPHGKAIATERDGEAGYLLSGRWAWGSGIHNADWVVAGGFITGEDGKPVQIEGGRPDQRIFGVPQSALEILDTWHVSGLCGTGSTDFQANEIFVPEAYAMPAFGKKEAMIPLFAFPAFGLLAIGIGAVALGIARAALDDFIELARGKTPDASRRVLAQRVQVQSQVAESEGNLVAARLFLHDAIKKAWDLAQSDGRISVEGRRDLRLAVIHAVRASMAIVDSAYTLGGGSSLYRRSPLQRHLRDIHVVSQHMMAGPAALELTGRLFLGLETDVAML